MAGIVRLTTVWTGFPGAPGYTNMYAHHNGVSAQDVADEFADDIADFWTAIDSYIPDDVTLTVDPTWVSLNIANGQIQSEGSLGAAPGAVSGLNAGTYAGNVGVAVDWHTDAFIAGHRLKGRTYVVPAAGCFGSSGLLEAIPRQAVIDAANALWAGSANMVVWHRPVNGAGGQAEQITSATVTNRAAVLRSRSL